MRFKDKEKFVDDYGARLLKYSSSDSFIAYEKIIINLDTSYKQKNGLLRLFNSWNELSAMCKFSENTPLFNLMINLLYKIIKEIETKEGI
jgi:hypothetical protein